MHISKVVVKNFRKFNADGTIFTFRKGINMILGENNGGKSSIIDVLRLALSSGQYRKGIYVNVSDFHINEYGERANEMIIDIYFEGLSSEQGVAFYQLTDGTDTKKAELHIKYSIHRDTKGNEKIKDSILGGARNSSIDKEVFDNINLVFMAALRNAENDLKPSRSSQLASLLYTFAEENSDKQRITSAFIEANEKVKSDEAISAVERTINENLNLIEKENLNQKISINLLPPTFESIASTLGLWYTLPSKFIKISKTELSELSGKHNISDISEDIASEIDENFVKINIIKLKEDKILLKLYEELITRNQQNNIELKQNGLGYNNLLSMAATLGDLKKKPSDEEISIFLVEEPEAHLHPQLLDLLFNFFKQSDESNKIQIFMTSHSPTLISKADIDSLNIIYEYENKVYCSALSDIGLLDEDKEDLKRYLDVTKSQLFFAKRVLFVEGISESILFSEFANLLKKPLDKYSVEIVNINGVAFAPFAKLFKDNDKHNNLKYPCAIVSDNDKCTNPDDPYVIKKEELTFSTANIDELKIRIQKGNISNRAKILKEFEGGNIKVQLAEKTLEYELGLEKDNNKLLLEILKKFHPQNSIKIEESINNKEEQEKIAIMIWLAIRDCKGAFAQRLASEVNKISKGIRDDVSFVVPKYIESAINFLIDK